MIQNKVYTREEMREEHIIISYKCYYKNVQNVENKNVHSKDMC